MMPFAPCISARCTCKKGQSNDYYFKERYLGINGGFFCLFVFFCFFFFLTFPILVFGDAVSFSIGSERYHDTYTY